MPPRVRAFNINPLHGKNEVKNRWCPPPLLGAVPPPVSSVTVIIGIEEITSLLSLVFGDIVSPVSKLTVAENVIFMHHVVACGAQLTFQLGRQARTMLPPGGQRQTMASGIVRSTQSHRERIGHLKVRCNYQHIIEKQKYLNI